MEKLYAEIKDQIESFNVNAQALISNGNKAAGARARKATLELTKLFKDFRKETIDAMKK